jgi:Fe-S-cluster-containing dehydrogenase component
MTRYGMVIDVTRCNGCYNCFIACKDEFCGNDHLPYSLAQPMMGQQWMRIIEKERGVFPKVKVAYTPVACMHCGKPSCVAAAQDNAVYQRDDGLVLIDPVKAAGKKELLTSCPYRLIFWNEGAQVPQKCTLCAHLLDAGYKEPRCVEACPTGALVFGDLDDADSEVSWLLASRRTEALRPEYGLEDKVRYLGLPRRFVAGSVVLGDTDECAVGVPVLLQELQDADHEHTVMTDAFGDFEFEGLAAGQSYTVRVAAPGYDEQTYTVTTTIDVYLGDIILQKTVQPFRQARRTSG